MFNQFNFKTSISWLLLLTTINFFTMYFIHTTKEKNYVVFNKKDISLAQDIISFSQTNNFIQDSYFNLKLSKFLFDKDKSRGEILFSPLHFSNFQGGNVLINLSSLNNPQKNELSINFTNIPQSQCSIFTEEILKSTNKVLINHSWINTNTDEKFSPKHFCNLNKNLVNFYISIPKNE